MNLSFITIVIEPTKEPFSIFPVDVRGTVIPEPSGKPLPFHFGAVDLPSVFKVMQTWVETHDYHMDRPFVDEEEDNASGL